MLNFLINRSGRIIALAAAFMLMFPVFAGAQNFEVAGSVIDEEGYPIPGAVVYVKGDTSTGVITNDVGEFTVKLADRNAVLVVSILGYETREIGVNGRKVLSVMLKTDSVVMEDAVVVGFAKQNKENVIGAVTSIKPAELKGPTSNLTTMIGSQVAGMISFQRSGEPGEDNAQFFVRGVGSFGAGKVDPLILIDGIESSNTDLARLQPDDISDFSVLKDASAAAVYGARGANGVILVNTKSGEAGKTKFNFRAENSISTNTQNLAFADNITYMRLANEAVLTRDPLAALVYSQDKIEHTANSDNPYLYPDNDWVKQLIKPFTMNQRFNANISGGGKVARYYVAATFNIDNGVLRNGAGSEFKNNISLKNYSIRSNTDLQLTRTTVATVRMYAQFDDYHGPVGGGGNVFASAMAANPVAFPATYPASYSPSTTHPMFGNALMPNTSELYRNPYAEMVSGYQSSNTSTINAQIEFKQDFGFWLPGLTARVMGYTQRYSYFANHRQYNPFYYRASLTSDGVELFPYNAGGDDSIGTQGTEYLNYVEGEKKVSTAYYGEAVVNYDHIFADRHHVTGMLLGTIRHYLVGNAGSLEASLPSRNVSLAGRFSYNYSSRYLVEFNFGYNGSERFAPQKRWGFFPSIAGGWIISNEKFYGSGLKKVLSNLKLRASYGLIGNDQIGKAEDRFFYLSNVDLNAKDDRFVTFGENFGYGKNGVTMLRYANYDIGWEESRQLNLGLDMTLCDINFVFEVYRQNRSNILLDRTYIPSTMGLAAAVKANTGTAVSQGVDLSAEYSKSFRSGWWTSLRANFTYASNKITSYDEPIYKENEYYRSRVGYSFGQKWGYVAERLFVDDEEVANSPKQTFGDIPVAAGDIKYKDINGDGVITEADMVPIGWSETPEINYSFGGTVGYKNFDISLYFQGQARTSLFIDPSAITPFALREKEERGRQNGLLKVIAEDHWSEDNRNLYAFWPRLSDRVNANNAQSSTWWMRNGSMLRLKSVEIGYNLPDKVLRKMKMSQFRIYLNANNLFNISTFDLWDPEMGSNGLNYPIQRVFNIGLMLGL